MNYAVPEKSDYYIDKSRHPIEEICRYTGHLAQVPNEVRYRMLDLICAQKGRSSRYGCYAAPPWVDTVARINGQGGHFLKVTAAAAGLYLIWYNAAKSTYMFWGPSEQSVRDGMNRLRGRIVKYVVHLGTHVEEEYTGETDYYDPEEPVKLEKLGKVITKQMKKMGFVAGHGLGREAKGRLEPINAVKELGGRLYNRKQGLGFTEEASTV